MLTHLDGVIAETADDLVVVVLQTVDSFTTLTPTLYLLQLVLPCLPVGVYTLQHNHTHSMTHQ